MAKRFKWLIAPLSIALLGITTLFGLRPPDGRLSADSLTAERDPRSQTFVARIYYDRIEDLNLLNDYDLWEYNNTKEKYVLASMDRAIFDGLAGQGWTIVIDEIRTEGMVGRLGPELFNGGYHTVDQLYADLESVSAKYPGLTELLDYGDSYCKSNDCFTLGGDKQPGYDLLAMRVTNEAVGVPSTISNTTLISGTKPVLFLVANIHAREIATTELAWQLLDRLITGYGVDADISWMVDWNEIWIVPMVNPDGHWLVELGERSPYSGSPFYQRKNANRSGGCTVWPPISFIQYGVDLNRNHSFAWGGSGSSTDPCSQTFKGSAAASEPEVAQLQALILGLIPDQRGAGILDVAPTDTTGLFITLHSFGELVLWPWGFSIQQAPNVAGLRAIGDRLAALNGYRSCQPTDCLYAASGTTDDWVYATLGIPAFTFEVGNQFMPFYSEVDSIQWPDNAPALLYAARIARTPYLTIQGPDVLALTTSVKALNIITITATIDGRPNGNLPISTTGYTIDVPYWVSGTISHPLFARDGAFDSSVEEVAAVLDLSDLILGAHTIFVRGQDHNGNWGPLYATYVFKRQRLDTFFPVWLLDGNLSLPARAQD